MSVEPVAPGIHRIDSIMGTRLLSQWLVLGDRGALLIDTGIAGTIREQVLPALDQLGLAPERVTEILISHADVDHYGGNGEARELLAGARIRAHPLDRPQIERWREIAAQRYGWYRSVGLDYGPDAWDWLERAAGSDTPLDGDAFPGELIDLGGIELELLHLPGHSLGHVGVFEPRSRTAIIADAAMGSGFPAAAGGRAGPPPYLDLGAYRDTIGRLRELGARRLGTTHFPTIEGEQVDRFLASSAEFTDQLERAVASRLAAGGDASVATLLPAVALELGGYPEMEVELARSIGAHLDAKTEGES